MNPKPYGLAAHTRPEARASRRFNGTPCAYVVCVTYVRAPYAVGLSRPRAMVFAALDRLHMPRARPVYVYRPSILVSILIPSHRKQPQAIRPGAALPIKSSSPHAPLSKGNRSQRTTEYAHRMPVGCTEGIFCISATHTSFRSIYRSGAATGTALTAVLSAPGASCSSSSSVHPPRRSAAATSACLLR